MSKRTDAVWRVIAFIWAWTIGSIILTIAFIVGGILAIVDVILQAITGRTIIPPDSSAFVMVAMTFNWWTDQIIYAFTGQGGIEFFPDF